MGFAKSRLALAIGAGVAGVGIFGAAALGAYVSEAPATPSAVNDPTAALASDETKPDRFKDLLDSLVKKGVITQQQEDAILAALKDAAGKHVGKRLAVLRDFLHDSAAYLGLTDKQLHEKLPGTSLAALANATPGKSRAELIAVLTKAGNEDIAKALTDKKITEDQAKKLRDELPNRVTTFVDRTWPKKPTTTRPDVNVKGFIGDLLQAGQSYLGLSVQDVRAQLATGKSLGEIANATPGKSRADLIATLTAAANTRIDQAAADKKISAEQATSLKAKVATEITTFVDRKWPTSVKTTAGNP